MYLLYVDESGDPGLTGSPTRYFVLSGLVVHELRWAAYLDKLIAFRGRMRSTFGLKLREEFHSSQLLSRPRQLVRIKRNDRLTMIRAFANQLGQLPDLSVINVVVDKTGKAESYDVFERAWTVLVQRFENTISHRNFPGPANPDERGIVMCDHTADQKLLRLLRQMRRYNPVPHQVALRSGHRNLPLQYVIEDPCFRDSAHSYFVQAVDLIAFLLYQKVAPSAYMRRTYGCNYFNKLRPILCLVASSSDADGIVWL